MSKSRNDAGWGGARPNAGRKPGVEKRTVQIRLTAEQHEKLKRLGGSKWIAEQIEKVENPKFGISLENI